ncbi:uncharacterized protein CLUP02_09212 [Colletotrichum lupini]|uniref:Uncharacterized protein n=1 Tax=Colletotrichum lupini TaxID=145971 RepID=A0A9Q8SUF0_9PEZI|nr:uncharacterized protein CLUP02_09212 [Colletotrichum lupini]UQC83716.1 hypothetical protein CLUP02_09212 [Colletotrichum lupini]
MTEFLPNEVLQRTIRGMIYTETESIVLPPTSPGVEKLQLEFADFLAFKHGGGTTDLSPIERSAASSSQHIKYSSHQKPGRQDLRSRYSAPFRSIILPHTGTELIEFLYAFISSMAIAAGGRRALNGQYIKHCSYAHSPLSAQVLDSEPNKIMSPMVSLR